jgi:hypothetical protein
VSTLREESRIRTTELPQVIHFVLETLVGLLEVKQPGLQLSPMGNARLNTETR